MFEIITIDELIKRLDKYNHKELHVHHTWRPEKKNYNGKNGIELQQGMRNYHVNNLGWSDIGQHVTLLPDGRFVTGRDFGKTPASIKGYNTGAFAVEMIGNFDKGHDVLEGAQKDSIVKLARYFDKKGKYIRFHRENSTKTCPGSGIDKNEFIKWVRFATPQPAPAPQRIYTVQKGDSLWKIAKKKNVYGSGLKWGQLAKLNNIKWPYKINVGQKIKY